MLGGQVMLDKIGRILDAACLIGESDEGMRHRFGHQGIL